MATLIQFCPKCGIEAIAGAEYCFSCGVSLKIEPDSAEETRDIPAEPAKMEDVQTAFPFVSEPVFPNSPPLAAIPSKGPSELIDAKSANRLDTPPTKLPKSIQIALIVTCVGLFLVLLLWLPPKTTDIPYNMGSMLVFATLAWLVFRFTVQAATKPTRNGIVFLSLYTTMVFGGVLGAHLRESRKMVEAKSAVPALKQAGESIIAAVAGKPDPGAFNAVTPPSGSIGTLVQWLNDRGEEYAELNANQQHDLEGLGINSLQDLSGISTPRELERRLLIVQRIRKATESYNIKFSSYLEKTRDSISTLDISEDEKEKVIVGFNNSYNSEENKQLMADNLLRVFVNSCG